MLSIAKVLSLVSVLLAVPLAACTSTEAISPPSPPAVLEAVDGSEFKLVVLTPKAAERLDIQTTEVTPANSDASASLVVPYSAILYGLSGETWVYTAPEERRYLRAPVAVDRIEDNRAFLSAGPDVGTAIVVVGAAMLYGTETGVGK